jgi:hypothetical protein
MNKHVMPHEWAPLRAQGFLRMADSYVGSSLISQCFMKANFYYYLDKQNNYFVIFKPFKSTYSLRVCWNGKMSSMYWACTTVQNWETHLLERSRRISDKPLLCCHFASTDLAWSHVTMSTRDRGDRPPWHELRHSWHLHSAVVLKAVVISVLNTGSGKETWRSPFGTNLKTLTFPCRTMYLFWEMAHSTCNFIFLFGESGLFAFYILFFHNGKLNKTQLISDSNIFLIN